MHQPAKNGDEVPDYGNITVTARELATVLGLSEAQVYTLRRRSILQSIKAKRTEFLLGPSVRAYIQYKCGQDSEATADFHKERALKEKANRELRQILVEQTRGQLHRACDVEAIQADSNNEIRSRLLAFSDLLASQLAGKDPSAIKEIIDKQVRKVLLELREYKPRDYYRRQRSLAAI
jgi:hypothetical protein